MKYLCSCLNISNLFKVGTRLAPYEGVSYWNSKKKGITSIGYINPILCIGLICNYCMLCPILSLPNCEIVRILSCKIENTSGLVLKFEWSMPLHLNHLFVSPINFYVF
jgi:hypothetical protein